MKDAYVEHGLNDRDAIAATNLPEDYPIVHVVRRHYEQWSRDVQAMPFSDQWKEHAQKQLSRYRASAEDSSLEILVESQIHTMLSILPKETVEGRVEPRLTAESLRFLISFLETKLDESVLASSKSKSPGSATSSELSRSKRSVPKSSDIGNVIKQLEKDEQVSELIGEVMSDGRFSELLEKVKKAEKN